MALQIKRKFILNDAIDSSKLLLQNGQALRVIQGSGGSAAEVELIKLDASGKVLLKGEEAALKSQVTAEQARAESAEDLLRADLNSEISARQGADTVLNGKIESEKARIDAILLASEADKDSFAEIVQLINSVDTSNDSAFAGYVTSNNAALAAEQSARQSADSALDVRLDTLEGSGAGSVAKAQADAQAFAEAKVNAEKIRAEGAEADLQQQITDIVGGSGSSSLSTLENRVGYLELDTSILKADATVPGSVEKAKADAQAFATSAVNVEKARAEAAEAGLSSAISAEASSRASAISAEASARAAADTALDGKISAEKARIDAILLAADADKDSFAEIVQLINQVDTTNDTAFGSYVTSNNQALAEEVANRIADVNAEESRAMAAEASLAADIGAEETRALAAEGQLSAAIEAEEQQRIAAISQLSGYVSATLGAEADARVAADELLDGRLDALEARAFYKVKRVLTAAEISAGFIELDHQARPNSIVASVGRLMIHEGASEDFEVTVVAGKSRMAFRNSIAANGDEALSEGDVMYVRYMA